MAGPAFHLQNVQIVKSSSSTTTIDIHSGGLSDKKAASTFSFTTYKLKPVEISARGEGKPTKQGTCIPRLEVPTGSSREGKCTSH